MKKKSIRKKVDSFFNGLSFSKKFVILFVGGLVFPMLIQTVVNYWQTERNIQEEMLEKVEEAMASKTEKIRGSLSGILALARSYYNNESLYRYLNEEYESDLDYLIRYQETLQVLFSEANLYPYEVRGELIYTDNRTLFNGSHVRRLDEVKLETLGEQLNYLNVQPVAETGGIYLRVAHENSRILKGSDSRSVSILCPLDHYRQYNKYDKVLRIDIDTGYWVDVLQESNMFENMFITDSYGSVIAAAGRYSNTGVMELFDSTEIEKQDDVILLSKQIGEFPLTLYGIYDMDMISQEFRQSRFLSIGISALCLLFALVYSYFIVRNMLRRLNRLVEQSKEIAKGNFIQSELKSCGDDEFGVLEKSMNLMSTQLSDLINREYTAQVIQAEKEKEANQARFLALQSQVNPHFMFNALESIRLKAMVKGEKETAQMIKYMAQMFRNLIQWDKNIITLKEEISFLDEFLHIQTYRYGDEFSYSISVSDEAYRCLVPKLILQPLVENACVHGMEAVEDERWVCLKASVEEGRLELKVEDNGGGMSEEKLHELRAMMKGSANMGKSVGLWNVYRRLSLYYGETFQFEIDSVAGRGTLCVISIPARETE